MKIAIVLNTLGGSGGAERYTMNLIGQLVALSHEVHVFTSTVPELPPQVRVHLMPVARRRYFHVAGRRIKGPRPNRLQRHLAIETWYREEVKKCAPDILLGMEKLLPADVFRAGGGVHRVWWEICHAEARGLRRWTMQRDPLHRHLLEVEKQLFGRGGARATICNSHMVAAELKRVYGYPAERIKVLHNGIDLGKFAPPSVEERAGLRARLGVQEGEKVLLFAGSGFWRKGLDRGLAIAAALQRRGVPFRYVVVGKGENSAMPRLARKLGLGSRVQFVGGQAPSDMLRWYQSADLFLFPSRYDPFANACLEAAACGVPVVTATGNGFQEAIEDGVSGLVLQEGEDAEAAAARIEKFLQDPPTPQQVRQSVAHLNLEEHVQALLSLLEEIGPRPGGWS